MEQFHLWDFTLWYDQLKSLHVIFNISGVLKMQGQHFH